MLVRAAPLASTDERPHPFGYFFAGRFLPERAGDDGSAPFLMMAQEGLVETPSRACRLGVWNDRGDAAHWTEASHSCKERTVDSPAWRAAMPSAAATAARTVVR